MTVYFSNSVLLQHHLLGVVVLVCKIVFASANDCDTNECFSNILGTVDLSIVNDFNNNEIFPRLATLLRRDYFKYFQYNSKRPCTLWNETNRGTCNLSACQVKACKPDELPTGLQYSRRATDESSCSNDEKTTYGIDATITENARQDLMSWQEHDSASVNFCDPDGCLDCDYVDLNLNPERHTGYSGDASRKLWTAIYQSDGKSTFHGLAKGSKACPQKRAFYCAVSGLHSSISVHIASQFKLTNNGFSYGPLVDGYGPNREEFVRRFDPELTDGHGRLWLKNLYFVYLLEMKALAKVGPYLKKKTFFTGNNKEDEKTRSEVVQTIDVIQTFPNPFSKSVINLGISGLERIFLNMSKVMDCVECDKCKLWGKLQVSGLGTALKILLVDESRLESWGSNFHLSRNEIVALWNAFGRISTSIHQLKQFLNEVP